METVFCWLLMIGGVSDSCLRRNDSLVM